MSLSWLPPANALLNATSAVLLIIGIALITRGRKEAHQRCMISAFAVSTLFLAGYLFYHFNAGTTRYSGTGWPRRVYFPLLLSHTVLAVAVPPLAITTLFLALKRRFDLHRRIARITFPIWLYVSVTGVVVYLMLRGDYPRP